MKKVLLSLSVIAIIGLTACDGSKRLAENLEGSWSGAPERLDNTATASATYLPTLDFLRTDDGVTGSVILSGLISVSNPVSAPTATLSEPFSMSASATSVVTGTWKAVDDDEIIITWSDSTLTVKVDPDAVVLKSEALTGATSSALDSIRPDLAESLRAQILKAVEIKVLGIRKIDDIKIDKGVMQCEINDVDYSFRQNTGN